MVTGLPSYFYSQKQNNFARIIYCWDYMLLFYIIILGLYIVRIIYYYFVKIGPVFESDGFSKTVDQIYRFTDLVTF